ncbi:MAG: type VI secretion system baseplate subunit TssF [Thermodesulfobacteriota bacterium]
MISRFYQQELNHLRELAVEFSKAHPALAPMLSGPSQDPDVERLLEGTAFLTGLVRQKLEDDFPEVIHGLMRLIFPHYLRPIPSTTIVTFSPKKSLKEALVVPAGTALDSVPVEGVKCGFRTCYDVEVFPLSVIEARLVDQPGRRPVITLRLAVTGVPLAAWKSSRLRLHLAGPYGEAATIWSLLIGNLDSWSVSAPGRTAVALGPENLKPVGLVNEESLLPYPHQSFPGYRILQEYFILPQKFLFLDLLGLDRWQDRGPDSEFEIAFVLKSLPPLPPQVRADSFVLFATPAVNIFPHDADPVTLDHRQPEYRLVPSGGQPDKYQVYSVESVVGFASGTVRRRPYAPFELFVPSTEDTPSYYVNTRPSAVRNIQETYLSVAYPDKAAAPETETLSIKLWCTNAALPENLKLGDISQATSSSPDLCAFKNILPPTSVVQPPLGQNLLWRFLSHLSLNLLTLATRDNLKAMLRLYIFPDSRDRAVILANEKRLEGIVDLSVRTVNRLVAGLALRGQEINLKLNPDHFASRGDLYLFGGVMDYFLGTYASVNCFTHLTVTDSLKGDRYEWPVRTGDRQLI